MIPPFVMRAAGVSRGAHRTEISFHNFPRQYTGKSKPAIKPVAKGVTALCLLRLNLPLARLLRKSETAAPKCCHLRAVERNRTQSQWRTLGFSSPHDIVIPQHSQKRFRRKIFCEEERRAFEARRSAQPNRPQGALRRDDVSSKEKVVNYFTPTQSYPWAWA